MLKSSAFYVIEGQRQGVSLADKNTFGRQRRLAPKVGETVLLQSRNTNKKVSIKKDVEHEQR